MGSAVIASDLLTFLFGVLLLLRSLSVWPDQPQIKNFHTDIFCLHVGPQMSN